VSIAVLRANTGTPPVGTDTVLIRNRASTPRFPAVDWIINPVGGIPPGVPLRYLKLVGDTVQEMTAGEKSSVDAAQTAAEEAGLQGVPRVRHFFPNVAALPAGVFPRGLVAGVGDVGTGRPGLAITDGTGGYVLFDSLP